MEKPITVYFDGAAILERRAGWGWYAVEGNTWLYQDYGAVPCACNKATSNVAEHYALGQAMMWLLKNGYGEREIVARGDSKLVICQTFGIWKIRNFSLSYAPYALRNIRLASTFAHLRGTFIPREENGNADRLSKMGLVMKKPEEQMEDVNMLNFQEQLL